jgi:hypothetical protein
MPTDPRTSFPRWDVGGTPIGDLANYANQLPISPQPSRVRRTENLITTPAQAGELAQSAAENTETGKTAAETAKYAYQVARPLIPAATPLLDRAGHLAHQGAKWAGRALTPYNIWRMGRTVQEQLGKKYPPTPGWDSSQLPNDWLAEMQSLMAIKQRPEDYAKLSPEAKKFVDWVGSDGFTAALTQFGITGGARFPIAGAAADYAAFLRGVARRRSEEDNRRHAEAQAVLQQPSRQNEQISPAEIGLAAIR